MCPRVQVLCGRIVVGALGIVVGCAPATDDDSANGSGSTEDTVRIGAISSNLAGVVQPPIPATVNCTTIKTKAPDRLIQMIGIAKDIVNVFNASNAGSAVTSNLTLVTDVMNTLMSGPTVGQELTALRQELDCTAQGLDWKMLALAYNDDQWAPVAAALNEALEVGITRGSAYDANAATGVLAASGFPMYERTWVESSTDTNVPCDYGGYANYFGSWQCNWKSIVPNHEPQIYDVDQVFDWRMGLPWFTQLIGMRVMIIALEDPLFAVDGQWNLELETGSGGSPGYRLALKQRLQQMTASISCDRRNNFDEISEGGYTTYQDTDIACADKNTGMVERASYYATADERQSCGGVGFNYACFDPLTAIDAIPIEDTLRREVLAQMPTFEVQSMIDTLRRFTHPWVPDLTQGAGRIAVNSNHNLCLDVQWGNPASGTPVWLWDCNGTGAQQWSYDRVAQTITNTAFGKCLQADPNAVMYAPGTDRGFVAPGAAIVQISDCIVPTPQWQQWSYDPELGVLHNGLGSVLDIQWNDQQAGTAVWLWDENDGAAQQWYADRNSSYCSSLCYPGCSAGCAGAGQGTGACVGGCMGSCVANCMSSATP